MKIKVGDRVILKSLPEIEEIETLKNNVQNINWDYVEEHMYKEFTVKYEGTDTLRLNETSSTMWPVVWFEPYAGIDFEIEELFIL